MRNSPQFQHGGDRKPRNEPGLTWEKPADVKRIVVLGDSLTFGDGVKAVETYPYKLQQTFRTRGEGKFQVINAGIMGMNTDQEAMILTEQNPYFGNPVLAFNPDLLILTICVNDIELMPDPKPRPETILLPKSTHTYLHKHYRLYRFVHKRLNRLFASLGVQPSYTEYLQHIFSSETKEWKLFKKYLNFILSVAKEQQKTMLLVIFPSLEKLDESHPYLELYSKIIEIGKAHGVEVLDLFPYFKGKNASSLRVSLLNGHPNGEAYEIVAEAIYNTIVEKNML
jgi:lysophospholipase L1-like esterase